MVQKDLGTSGPNSLIERLRSFDLPTEDFAIFGSGPMMAHGIKESHDLDIISRGAAWEKAQTLAEVKKSQSGGKVVELAGGLIELFPDWPDGEWDINRLIDEAEVIDGIRFVRLKEVLQWKRNRNAPKDPGHIKLIEEYLARQ